MIPRGFSIIVQALISAGGKGPPGLGEGRRAPLRAGGQTRETAASIAEDGEYAEKVQSRDYQVTVWSNSKAGSGTAAVGSKTEV